MGAVGALSSTTPVGQGAIPKRREEDRAPGQETAEQYGSDRYLVASSEDETGDRDEREDERRWAESVDRSVMMVRQQDLEDKIQRMEIQNERKESERRAEIERLGASVQIQMTQYQNTIQDLQDQVKKQQEEVSAHKKKMNVPVAQPMFTPLNTMSTPSRNQNGLEAKLFPMKYDGSTDFEAYQSQFECIAVSRGWSSDEKATVLISRLKGKALEAAEVKVNRTYDEMVKALKKRFSPDVRAIWRTKLRSRKQQPKEELVELHADVKKLVVRAHPGVGDEGIGALARDHYIEAIADQERSRMVSNSLPKTYDDA